MKYYEKIYSEIRSFEPAQLQNLKKLGSDIQEDVVSELLELHFAISATTIAQIEKFYSVSNLKEVAFLAHQYKSNCCQLGLVKLHRALNDLENLIRFEEADIGKVSELMDIIRKENEIGLNYLTPFKKGA